MKKRTVKINTPDVSEISLGDLDKRLFPSLIEYRITISNKAYKAIHKHSRENSNLELCGVLIGEVFKDENGPFLEITDIIKGEHAENEGAQVTFTHETWSHISRVKDSTFPDKRIVGWYHTHPSFGIFLSEQDLFIHENFFNQAWQVAFVVDPVSEDEGFFVWYDGNPVGIDNYWVAGRKKKISSERSHSKKQSIKNVNGIVEPALKDNNQKSQSFHVYIFLIITISLLFIYQIYMNRNLKEQLSSQLKYLSDLSYTQLHSDQTKKYIKIEEIRNVLARDVKTSGLSIKLKKKGNHVWCIGKVSTLYQKDLIGKMVASVNGVESVDVLGIVVTHQYVTLPGDSLIKIAEKLYGNPGKWKEIYEMNSEKIIAPHKIQPSVTLILPGDFY